MRYVRDGMRLRFIGEHALPDVWTVEVRQEEPIVLRGPDGRPRLGFANELEPALATVRSVDGDDLSDRDLDRFESVAAIIDADHDALVDYAYRATVEIRRHRASKRARVAEQLATAGPVDRDSSLYKALIAGADFVHDHAQITDSGCGASIDLPDDGAVEMEAQAWSDSHSAPAAGARK